MVFKEISRADRGHYRIFRKTITRGRSHQQVSAEVFWTFAILPLEFGKSSTVTMHVLIVGLQEILQVISLFSTSITSAYYSPEVNQLFTILKVVVWTNCILSVSHLIRPVIPIY